MRKVFLGVFLATLCFASVAVADSATVAIWGTDGAAVTNDDIDQLRVSVSGDKVVWSEYDKGGNETDNVVGYDFSQKVFFDVSSSAIAEETDPVVSGDVVVWVETLGVRPYTDVYIKDLVTGDEVNISDIAGSNGRAGSPSIDGDFVVWDETDDPQAPLRVYHLPSGEEVEIPKSGGSPDIWSDGEEFRLVWEDESGSMTTIAYATGSFDLETAGFSAVTTQTVWDMFPSGTPAQAGDMNGPSIWGDVIAWFDWRRFSTDSGLDVYAFDMATGVIHDVGVADDHDINPQVYNGWVSWEHWRGGNEIPEGPLYTDHYLYSIAEEKGVRVTETDTPKAGLVFEGNRLAWIDRSPTDYEVRSMVLDGPVGRTAGSSRYGTAVMASQLHFTSSRTVVLATGENYPDGLAAASLAGAYECPILLTPGDALPATVKTEIDRLGASQIVIVGGYAAITQELQESLEPEYDVRRRMGPTRYETARVIAEDALGIWGTDGAAIWGTDGAARGTGIWGTDGAAREKTIFVARGDSFADALAVSPVAYRSGIPVLLTKPGALSPEVSQFMEDNGTTEVIIIGGSGAVSDPVQAAIDSILDDNGGDPSERWFGADRYETAKDIAEEALDRGWVTLGRVGFVTGRDFPDALSGGPSIGIEGGVLLMVDPNVGPQQGSAAGELLDAYHAGVGRMEAFGGMAVLGASTLDSLEDVWSDSFEAAAPAGEPTLFEHPDLFADPISFGHAEFF